MKLEAFLILKETGQLALLCFPGMVLVTFMIYLIITSNNMDNHHDKS